MTKPEPERLAAGAEQAGLAPVDEGGLPAPQRHWAVLVILLGLGLAVLDGSVVTLALPTIAAELGIAESATIWLISANQLALLCLLLPVASLGYQIGYKRMYLIGVAAFALSAVLCVLAQDLWTLILGRALQGAFSATLMTSTTVLMRRTYPFSLLGQGIAMNALVVGTASVAGPSVAALLLSLLSWHWLFGISIPFGALVVWLGLRHLPPDPVGEQHDRVNWLDVVLNISTFGLFFWGFKLLAEEVASGGLAAQWLQPAMLMLLGALVGYVYVQRQRRQAEPILPLDLLRIRLFSLSVGSSVSAFAAQMISLITLPFLLLVILQRSTLQTGLLISVWPLASVLTAPVAGRLIGTFSSARLGLAGMLLLALGQLLLALMPADVSPADMAWRLAICGVGFALFQSPNNHTIITSAPASRSGAAGGMLSGARLTGQSLGAALAAGIFALFPPTVSGSGPQWCFAVATGFAVAAALLSNARE